MYPTIRPGDRVLLSPVRAALVRGDVVIVPLGRSVLLHRVVSLTNGSALTMGDACKMPDRPIDVDSVFARAVAIRRETAVTALTPTLRFGVWALCRFAMSEVRRRAAAARGRLGAWRRKG
jgi:hypothetical protein